MRVYIYLCLYLLKKKKKYVCVYGHPNCVRVYLHASMGECIF